MLIFGIVLHHVALHAWFVALPKSKLEHTPLSCGHVTSNYTLSYSTIPTSSNIAMMTHVPVISTHLRVSLWWHAGTSDENSHMSMITEDVYITA